MKVFVNCSPTLPSPIQDAKYQTSIAQSIYVLSCVNTVSMKLLHNGDYMFKSQKASSSTDSST